MIRASDLRPAHPGCAANRRAAVVVLALIVLAPGCRSRSRKRPKTAPARVDAAAAAKPAVQQSARPIPPDAATLKGAAWCSEAAEGNEAQGVEALPVEVASPGALVAGTRLNQIAKKGCCKQAARWRAKLKSARVEFVVLEEARRNGDGIFALVLRRLPSGYCVLGSYAKIHGGVGTSFQRVTDREVGQQGQMARMTFRFRGERAGFENDDGSFDPGEITHYNVVLITDGLKLWTATWTDTDLRDLRTAVMTGRRLASQGQLDESLEIYERAQAIQPYSPQIAAELGFVALRAGNLKLAKKYLRRALRFAFGSVMRGKILYNLGRISEQSGDLERAEEHYRRSFKLRASREVRKRLRALKRRRSTK